MNILGFGLIVAGLVCGADEKAPRPVNLSMWAVKATQEGRQTKYFDPGLEPIQGAVGDLPFDTYRKVQTAKRAVPYNEEGRFPIDAKYTLFVKPQSKEADGRIRLDVRIEMASKTPGGQPVKALGTELVVKPGEKVKFGGLKLEDGTLVVLMAAGD